MRDKELSIMVMMYAASKVMKSWVDFPGGSSALYGMVFVTLASHDAISNVVNNSCMSISFVPFLLACIWLFFLHEGGPNDMPWSSEALVRSYHCLGQ